MVMDRGVQLFSVLKPVCTRLTEATIGFGQKKYSAKAVVDGVAALYKTLQQAARDPNAIEKKYADYVFFPLIGILREHQNLPVCALELALQCIRILLSTGWRLDIEPKVAIQLLIFCTVLNDSEDSQSEKIHQSEELHVYGFQCTQGIFSSLGKIPQGKACLTETASIPFVGKAVSVILYGASKGASGDIQHAAILALQEFCISFPDQQALAISFLPGIVSCLTQVLTPNTQFRRSFRQYESALDVVNDLFHRVLSDEATKSVPGPPGSAQVEPKENKMTRSWLNATSGQVKLVLSQIVKLRQHERVEVRRALSRLCVTVLEKCSNALSESVPLMLETLVTALSIDQDIKIEIAIKHLLNINMAMGDLLKSSLRQWCISLPRIMQGHDDTPKRRIVLQISTTFRVLHGNHIDTSLVEDTLATSLRDSVSCLILESEKARQPVMAAETNSLQTLRLSGLEPSKTFDDVLLDHHSQEDVVKSVQQLIAQLGEERFSISRISLLVNNLPADLQTNDKLASMWLALRYLQSIRTRQGTLEDFMDAILITENNTEISNNDLLDQIYSFSLSALTQSDTAMDQDWRLQCLCLETLALQAEHQKQDFRGELVESLYPVVHLVGSPNGIVQKHAMTTLNIIAKACGYSDAASLIVSNVDYLVNAIALKLNTFDISPQAPIVLLMMIKLTGPSLIPYLDDLVDSIFAALDNYHGYPLLVELLFKVLRGIAEEGSKAPQLAITMDGSSFHAKRRYTPTSMQSLTEGLTKATIKRREWDREETRKENAGQPNSAGDEHSSQELTELPPPQPKTYKLLLNISRLTQHYLTAASPSLRNSLLSLLRISFPALATHENSFLPLINTLWPVLVSRLDDPEPYVVVGALDAIALLCTYAGDFMRSRIDVLWPHLKRVYNSRERSSNGTRTSGKTGSLTFDDSNRAFENVVETALMTTSSAGDHFADSPARLVRDGIYRLISAIVRHTAVDESTYDEMLELAAPVLVQRSELREALEIHNPDAVWLSMIRVRERQTFSDIQPFKAVNVLSKVPVPPVGKPGWVFA